jgi:hypothetical protein
VKVWALWSSCVGAYSNHELIDLFTSQEVAERVRAELVGKPRYPQTGYRQGWKEDEDFPDLYVRPFDLR